MAQLAALWPELTAFGRHLPASAAFNKNKITGAGGFVSGEPGIRGLPGHRQFCNPPPVLQCFSG